VGKANKGDPEQLPRIAWLIKNRAGFQPEAGPILSCDSDAVDAILFWLSENPKGLRNRVAV
jgi:hypothetical protein